MGKIVKFLLKAVLFLFIIGIAVGLIEQFGGALIVVVVIVAVFAAVGKSSRKPKTAKKPEEDEIEKLHVEMED